MTAVLSKLAMPVKAFDLLQTAGMLLDTLERRKRKRRMRPKTRSEEDRKLIGKAKEILMQNHNMTEEEVHRYLQKKSMDSGTNLVEMSKMVLEMYR